MNIVKKFKNKVDETCFKAYCALKNTKGESYVDTGVKMLIAIVIGALLLTVLYNIMDNVVLDNVQTKIQGFFNQTPSLPAGT